MVENAFMEEPLTPDVEEIVHDIVIGAFNLGDCVHEEYSEGSMEGDGASLHDHEVTLAEDIEGHEYNDDFDPTMLEEAI